MRDKIPKNSIKSWAEDDRPREKLAIKGAETLSDAELLAILIQNGTRDKSAVELAREVLMLVDNDLDRLGRQNVKEFQKTKGIGPAKAITLMAALELGRRRQVNIALEEKIIHSSQQAAAILIPHLQDLNHEVFCALYMNHKGKLIHYETVSTGGVTQVSVDVKMIMKNAVQHLATQMIIAHNHPSGNLTPSRQDDLLTEKVKNAAFFFDIKLCDHIIVAGKKYYSYADEGCL